MWTPIDKILTVITLICISLAIAAWLAYSKGYSAGAAQVQTRWDTQKSQILQATNDALVTARAKQTALEAAVTKIQQAHKNETTRITTEHRKLVDSLRNRPTERADSGGVPQGAAAGIGCTGAGLSRPDAEFLIGFASDAARTKAALNTCVKAYNSLTTP
jgi:hypothetical protein